MRTQRAFSIQTWDQYYFCYTAVIEYAQRNGKLSPVQWSDSDLDTDSEWDPHGRNQPDAQKGVEAANPSYTSGAEEDHDPSAKRDKGQRLYFDLWRCDVGSLLTVNDEVERRAGRSDAEKGVRALHRGGSERASELSCQFAILTVLISEPSGGRGLPLMCLVDKSCTSWLVAFLFFFFISTCTWGTTNLNRTLPNPSLCSPLFVFLFRFIPERICSRRWNVKGNVKLETPF